MIREAGVEVDIVDVGGGFPVAYPDVEVPPLGAILAEIEARFDALDLPSARLWAEPGRALVVSGGSVVVQVLARRGDALYINDGVYGSLADAGVLGFRYRSAVFVTLMRWMLLRHGHTASSGRPAIART